MELNALKTELIKLFEELHQQQSNKAAAVARKYNPNLTSEDLLNPDNFTQVIKDPNYMYEDGQAAGILSAKMAVIALINSKLSGD